MPKPEELPEKTRNELSGLRMTEEVERTKDIRIVLILVAATMSDAEARAEKTAVSPFTEFVVSELSKALAELYTAEKLSNQRVEKKPRKKRKH